jgi:hypothetical protein
MCLRDTNRACRDYQPDYNHPSERGQLCYGMGHTPPCKNCGQRGPYHADSFDPPPPVPVETPISPHNPPTNFDG